VKIAINQK